jgi:hypothetical protein
MVGLAGVKSEAGFPEALWQARAAKNSTDKTAPIRKYFMFLLVTE